MTRVVQLCLDPGIAYGAAKGAAVHLAELARALAGRGAEVLMIVSRVEAGAAPPPPGVTVEVLPGPGHGTIGGRLAAEPVRAAWLAARLRRWGADAVYERFALHTTAGVDAALAVGVPHLTELNAALPFEARRYRRLDQPQLAAQMEQAVLCGTDTVLAVSRPLARYASARGAKRTLVSPNAVDPLRFPVAADAGADPPVAVFVGSLRPWHGSAMLADAWSLLGGDAPHLMVVGDGAGRDRLEAVGATITGTIAPDAVPALLARAQIGLAPYPSDAPDYFSPLKVYEYLAAGLAVVASQLPGIVDVVAGNAVLVPKGDATALATAVGALAGDTTRRAQLGAAGRDVVIREHTWADRARSILELVEAVTPTGARR